MKKTIFKRYISMFSLLLCAAAGSHAQSSTTIMGSQDLGGQTEYAQYLYIAPGAVVSLSTDWVISSQYIFIAPGAQILGPGKMIIDNPAKFGPVPEAAAWAGQATTIDGGNAQIMAPVEIRNPNNVVLGTVPITQSGGDITTANTDHTLYIGTNLNFATANGDGSAITSNDVVLGANELKIAGAATITNYDPNSFVVTAGQGHIYKMPYTGTFVFPVGIADGDYTPASVTATANGVHVNVRTYAIAPAGSITAPSEGIDRLWNIYGDNATGANICLEHNTITNGANFNDAAAFVTRYVGSAPNSGGDNVSQSTWQSNTPGAGTTGTMMDPAGSIAGSSTHCRTFPILATTAGANGAWHTKSSDINHPLPIALEYFRAKADGCNAGLEWKSGTEKNFSHFEVLRSPDGSSFERVATVAGTNSAEGHVYTYTIRQDAAVAFYKLKLVDMDGTATYSSDVRRVANNCAKTGEDIIVYPNPAGNASEVIVKYDVSDARGSGKLWLCDIAGRVLSVVAVDVAAGTNRFHIPVQTLAAGTYIVRLSGDTGNWNVSPVKLTIESNR